MQKGTPPHTLGDHLSSIKGAENQSILPCIVTDSPPLCERRMLHRSES